MYTQTQYTVCHISLTRVPGIDNLFTLENCDGRLILKTEIRDENSELIAKIDRNEFIQINGNFDVQGEIENGNGFTLTRKEDVLLFSMLKLQKTSTSK